MYITKYHEDVRELALGLLKRQTFIPSRLLEERLGEPCMCTGASVLFAAYLLRGGDCDTSDFFADLAAETDDDFVERQARQYGLDPIAVRSVIINSKAIEECDRPEAVGSLLRAFVDNSVGHVSPK
jgi:hypothetical protein